jgi:hypothetical protein
MFSIKACKHSNIYLHMEALKCLPSFLFLARKVSTVARKNCEKIGFRPSSIKSFYFKNLDSMGKLENLFIHLVHGISSVFLYNTKSFVHKFSHLIIIIQFSIEIIQKSCFFSFPVGPQRFENFHQTEKSHLLFAFGSPDIRG